MIRIIPLTGIGEIEPGSDLAAILIEAIARSGIVPGSNDILVVTQKIASKAEGRMVDLAAVTPSGEAIALAARTTKDPRLVELVLAESSAVVRAARDLLIARHRCGFVLANAGIDQSNIGPGSKDRALLLPLDADRSAASLRAALGRHWSAPPAVIIADSFGRPWRNGVVNVAIGASGLPALVDRRGEADRDGRPLAITQVALGDLVASAAALAAGEGAEGVPAVLVSGVKWTAAATPAAALVRPIDEDLFQ